MSRSAIQSSGGDAADPAASSSPSSSAEPGAAHGAAGEAGLAVGRRYFFDGWGAYDVAGVSQYEITGDDGEVRRWDSWGLVGVDADNEGQSLCVVATTHMGLCYALEVASDARPDRAAPFAPYCGEVAVSDCQCVDLDERPPKGAVLFRTRMDAWLDNGADADGHETIEETAVVWIEERFIELPAGEEHKFPDMLYLQLRPVRGFRRLD